MTAPLERIRQNVEDTRAFLAACLTSGTRLNIPEADETLDYLIRAVRRHDTELLRAYGGPRRRGQWAIDLLDPDKEPK